VRLGHQIPRIDVEPAELVLGQLATANQGISLSSSVSRSCEGPR
jgi:hypothetical protein